MFECSAFCSILCGFFSGCWDWDAEHSAVFHCPVRKWELFVSSYF